MVARVDVAVLRGDERRNILARSSTAERVVDVLRELIMGGELPPGTRLSEGALGDRFGVSRNTLREAFRLLGHERLLDHQFNRGVFVRGVSRSEIADLYRARAVLEPSALAHAIRPLRLEDIRDSVKSGRSAARRRDWKQVGTADLRFHQALVALAGSSRLDEMLRALLAELRLVFLATADQRALHQPFVERNAALLGLLETGRVAGAQRELKKYLTDAASIVLRIEGSS
jgi:DNA-binding GntR family transcriptional regulator